MFVFGTRRESRMRADVACAVALTLREQDGLEMRGVPQRWAVVDMKKEWNRIFKFG